MRSLPLSRFTSPAGLAIVLVLLGVCVRLHGVGSEPLWYDELYSATQAASDLTEVVPAVRAYDMHPPLYYFQLSAWSKLGHSAVWLRLNSVVWWILAAAALYYSAERLISSHVGGWATLLYALNPASVHFAQELRMYSMLMALAVCGFYLTERWFSPETSNPRSLGLPMLLVTTAIVYAHGASFLILLGFWSHAFWMLLTRQAARPALLQFMGVQLLCVLLGLAEQVRAAAMHLHFEDGLSYAIAPTVTQFIRQTSWLVSGRGEWLGPLGGAVTLCVAGTLLISALWREGPGRRAILFYAVLPTLTCLLISHVSRPIWVFRVISFTIPFICLGLASGIANLAGRRSQPAVRVALVTALVAISLVGMRAQQAFYPRPSFYFRMAQVIREKTEPEDVIYVPQRYSYWALCWYLVGPGSVQPLSDRGYQRDGRGTAIVKTGNDSVVLLESQQNGGPATVNGVVPSDGDQPVSTRSVSQRETPRYWLLTIGEAQSKRLVGQVEQQHGVTPLLVNQAGTIRLWRLSWPCSRSM